MNISDHDLDDSKSIGIEASHSYRVVVGPVQSDRPVLPTRHVITAHQLGITNLVQCQTVRLFFLHGSLSEAVVRQIASELLSDPVTEQFEIGALPSTSKVAMANHSIEVTLLPGVTDPAAENLLKAANVSGFDRAATGYRFELVGDLTHSDLAKLATEVFSNPVVQRYSIDCEIEPPFFEYHKPDRTVEYVQLSKVDDLQLMQISSSRRLALDLVEMQAIRAHYQSEKHEPSDVELEMLAQTWSEHCVHKTFRAYIDCVSPQSTAVYPSVDGLLRSTIKAATERVNKPWVHSAFVDNAGIVAFDDEWDLAFKVETHNHPSALEPFGGANTGTGGVIRDILGVSARPIANTDVLCFGTLDMAPDDVPAGVLHPRRIAAGVIHGIEDYGNKMGIPTVNGAILYHPGYTSNPLVFCGCLGLLPRGSHPSTPHSGDFVVVIGGLTGRDGLRGATFSSMEMDQATGGIAGTAVQIGHPIHEKQTMEAVLMARDAHLYSALTDCGAGGLSSAVGELAKGLGVQVDLASVPLKYPGLRPWEIWLSEAQERMVLAVPPTNWLKLKSICDDLSIKAICIGAFENTGRIRLSYDQVPVADIDVHFLHDGIPRRRLKALIEDPIQAQHSALMPSLGRINIVESILRLLAHPDIRSKEDVIRLYDHEVQGGTVIKPLTGVANHGPSDAAVLIPQAYISAKIDDKNDGVIKGVALSNGICPAYTELDPYAMAWAAIDEAMRNAVAVGADPDQVSLLDNFCWGNPTLPDRLGSLVQTAQGCYDAAIAFNAPFISGKDSLNNEYTASDGRKHAIPGTLLISAMGIVPDIDHTVTMDFKSPNNSVYVVGETREELGGSHLFLVLNQSVNNSPVPQPVTDALDTLRRLHKAICRGYIKSCHDASEGGLAVAISEMCLAGNLGATLDLSKVPCSVELSDAETLFSESNCRFIIEVAHEDCLLFESIMAGITCSHVGEVTTETRLLIIGHQTSETYEVGVSQLDTAWRSHISVTGGAVPTITPSRVSKQSADTYKIVPVIATRPQVLIMHATGTNRDHDAALACTLAGGDPTIVHIKQLVSGDVNLLDYAMLVVPGGFSYGDDLGAGTLWALDMRHSLQADLSRFVTEGRPVLGICNGFQALVKANLLPGQSLERQLQSYSAHRQVTLSHNASDHFECRWVHLRPEPASKCIFTAGLSEPIYCPVAHGEGRVAVDSVQTLESLRADCLIALSYIDSFGNDASYPENPNGSVQNVAGLTNHAGNILGLMPHPENHIFKWQHPRWHRGEAGNSGLGLFTNGIRYAKGL